MSTGLAFYGAGIACAVFACAYGALGGRATNPSARGTRDPLGAVLDDASMRLQHCAVVANARRRSERDARRSDALRQLPVMLDVLTLGLSAGLSFDASLELYCQHYHTGLSAALHEAMLAWRMGAKTRSRALHDLAEDLDVAALRHFSAAVSQALAFGAPLASALERQAQVIRDEQRSEMEAEIERVPVRMLIPLGTLIVPAMLLAILGPLLGSSIVLA